MARRRVWVLLSFGVPYFNAFCFNLFLTGTIMKYKFILFSPWLLQSLVMAHRVSRDQEAERAEPESSDDSAEVALQHNVGT